MGPKELAKESVNHVQIDLVHKCDKEAIRLRLKIRIKNIMSKYQTTEENYEKYPPI